jgi:hypothetical protein
MAARGRQGDDQVPYPNVAPPEFAAMFANWLPRRPKLLRRPARAARRIDAAALVAADPAVPEEPGSTCGWFDSSWELRRGLQVIEHTGFERLPPEVPLAWLLV